MVNHSALKCLLAADSDSVVSGTMTTVEEMALPFFRGHWALEQVMAVCAKIRMRLKCKKREKIHIFVFLAVVFTLSFSLSADIALV